MADSPPLDAAAAHHAAVATLARGVLAPACLEEGSAVGALERAIDGRHLRAIEQGEGPAPAEGESQRSPSAVFRAKQRLLDLPLYRDLIRIELYDQLRLSAGQDGTGSGVPVQVLEERLRLVGWEFGTHRRSAALHAGELEGWAIGSSRRWYRPGAVAPEVDPVSMRAFHLSRWLGSVTRTLSQRFQRIEGSFFWTMGFVQLPARSRQFVSELAGWMEGWLRRHHVPWPSIPRGGEGELVMLTVALLSGAAEPAPGEVALSPWRREMLLPILGGDLARRLGGVDLAAWTLQRSLADGVLERLLAEAAATVDLSVVAPLEMPLLEQAKRAARAAGISPARFARERCGLDWQTVEEWQSGPAVDPDAGDPRANGGPVGAAMVRLQNLLVEAHPRRVAEPELFRRMRERYSTDIARPEVVSIALARLETDDVIGSIIEYGVRSYQARFKPPTVQLVDWRKMRVSLAQDLRPLPGLVDQVWADHPAAGVASLCYVIPRNMLQTFVVEARNHWHGLRTAYERSNQGLVDEELLAAGQLRSIVLIQGRVTPIPFKRPESKYR